MVLCLNDNKDKLTVIKLADVVTLETAFIFLHSLDFENLCSASICDDHGIIIYKINVQEY